MKKILIKRILPFVFLTIALIFLIPKIISPKENVKEEIQKEAEFQNYLKERIEKRNVEKKNYLTGHFNPSERADFAFIPVNYNTSGYETYLRRETLDAFIKMAEIAKKDNIELKIASATRNFNYQKNLWNDKWTGLTLVDGKNLYKSISDGKERFNKILEYSAAPGTSRHHWGTDIDINNANPAYFATTKGKNVYLWLSENAFRFGFCQPYNQKNKNRPYGYNEEKWHWSYLPLARTFTQEYKNLITDQDINGFEGDEYVPTLNLINNYVLAINLDCL